MTESKRPVAGSVESYYSQHLQSMYDSIPGEFPTDDDGRTMFRKWLYESLLWGLGELERGNIRGALRCLLQAKEYVGRIGGYWPTPGSHDAAAYLQNAIEEGVLVPGNRSCPRNARRSGMG